jgi:Transposase DDE domain group 1
MLRPGNAGANSAADHISVTDAALAQIPDEHRHGTPILVRADGAGGTKAWLTHLRGLRDDGGLDVEFSVGFTMTDTVQQAILDLPELAWTPAVDADGELREGAGVAELTGLLPDPAAAGWPDRMRVIVRRERPHPGAQLSFTDIDGWRFQAFATDTTVGQLAALEARHRGHATVEDRIRCGKHTGLGRFPSRMFAINAVWLELALTAADLIAWTQTILLDGDLARCAEDAALPAAARRRPHHPRPTASVRAHRRALAMAARAGRRVRPPRRPPTVVCAPDRPTT